MLHDQAARSECTDVKERSAQFTWIVAKTKPAQERLAAKHVARQDHEYYLPLIRNSSDNRIAPLFPSYIFIHVFNMRFSFINSTRGISRIVTFGEQIATVTSEDIMSIMRNETLGLVVLPSREVKFNTNARIRVSAGPLLGKVGLFIEHTSNERVRALFDVIGGRKTVCTLKQSEIELAA